MKRNVWRTSIAISLALNVFLLTLGGAVVWRLHRGGGLNTVIHFISRGMAPADAAIVRRDFMAARPSYAASLQTVSAAHQAVDAALREQPFDPAALQTALDHWRRAFSDLAAAFEPPYVAAAGQISQAGREHLADRGDAQARRSGGMMSGN